MIEFPGDKDTIMFKLNDKKYRKRALMKLQCVDGYKPHDSEVSRDDKEDFYNVKSGDKVTNHTIEIQYKFNDSHSPNPMVRKTMKFEEVHLNRNGSDSGIDTVDRATSSRMFRNFMPELTNFHTHSQHRAKVQLVNCSHEISSFNTKLDQG